MNRVILSDNEEQVLLVTDDNFQLQSNAHAAEYNEGDGSKFVTPTATGRRPPVMPAKVKRQIRVQQERQARKATTGLASRQTLHETPAFASGATSASALLAPHAQTVKPQEEEAQKALRHQLPRLPRPLPRHRPRHMLQLASIWLRQRNGLQPTTHNRASYRVSSIRQQLHLWMPSRPSGVSMPLTPLRKPFSKSTPR